MNLMDMEQHILSLNWLSHGCHEDSKSAGWYSDLQTGEDLKRNLGEMFALMHSELSEGLDGVRKDKQDDHLPTRKSEEVELADLLIRVFDYAGYRKLDLSGAMLEKMEYNLTRADHKAENRAASTGKKF